MKFEKVSESVFMFVSRRFYEKSHLFQFGYRKFYWMLQQWVLTAKMSGLSVLPDIRKYPKGRAQ